MFLLKILISEPAMYVDQQCFFNTYFSLYNSLVCYVYEYRNNSIKSKQNKNLQGKKKTL